tara:strand:- start:2389 stop:3009 length:621 start_codon:yes stop_codon:yes gene_type:complete
MSTILSTIAASILGLIIFLVHSYFLNQYLRTKNNLALALMLPMITAIITKTISTNLFLSLGMIGALSIVRYRTPVKSTYELTLLFALVTIGISSIVNIKYSVFLTILIVVISFLLHLLSKFNLIKDFEGENDVNNSEVILKTRNKFDEKNLNKYQGNLISKEQDFEDEKYKIFVFKFNNFEKANDFCNELENEENVLSVNLQNYFN